MFRFQPAGRIVNEQRLDVMAGGKERRLLDRVGIDVHGTQCKVDHARHLGVDLVRSLCQVMHFVDIERNLVNP